MSVVVGACFLILLQFQINQCMSWKCPFGKIYIETSEGEKCFPCVTCLPGFERQFPCNNILPHKDFRTNKCIPCPIGSYKTYVEGSCRRCQPECKLPDEQQIQPCDATHDRVCVCRQGYRRHLITGKCVKPDGEWELVD